MIVDKMLTEVSFILSQFTHLTDRQTVGRMFRSWLYCGCTTAARQKLAPFWWNLVYHFLSKFAAKSCKIIKTFSPHYWVVTEKKEFIPPQLWPQLHHNGIQSVTAKIDYNVTDRWNNRI